MTSYDRPGLLERLTSSTAFAVLLCCAGVVLAPTVLLGLAMLPLSLAQALQTTSPYEWAMLLLPLGGAAGFIGLFLTARPPQTLAGYRIMMLCIAIGIATAIVLAGGLVVTAGPDDPWVSAIAVLVLIMPVLAAFGRVARLRRLRAAAEGRPRDALPLIFLAVALGELACAIAIGAQLALVG
jgi:hypothetical protein